MKYPACHFHPPADPQRISLLACCAPSLLLLPLLPQCHTVFPIFPFYQPPFISCAFCDASLPSVRLRFIPLFSYSSPFYRRSFLDTPISTLLYFLPLLIYALYSSHALFYALPKSFFLFVAFLALPLYSVNPFSFTLPEILCCPLFHGDYLVSLHFYALLPLCLFQFLFVPFLQLLNCPCKPF